MTILASELKFYRSTVSSDVASTNGGRLSSNQIISGAMGSLFPTVSPAERASGIVRHRKMFAKVDNDADLVLSDAYLYMTRFSQGDDRLVFFAGTQRGVQSSLTGSERKYGCGILKTSVSSGATSCVVTVEDGSVVQFATGDRVRLSDQTTYGVDGNEDFVILSSTPSVSGNDVTLTFTGTPLANDYSNADTYIGAGLPLSDLQATLSDVDVTSASGTLDDALVTLDNIGTVEQTWTLTFVNATTYTIVGDTLGTVGSGTVGSGASPINPAFAKPYFNVPVGAFYGTFATGETTIFQTHPAAKSVWLRQTVPEDATVDASNAVSFVLMGSTP